MRTGEPAMGHEHVKITCKSVFMIALSILLTSRVLVLTENYNWVIDPVLVEIIYLFATMMLIIAVYQGKVRFHQGKHILILAILLIHTVLWGTVFVDHRFADEIKSHFSSQIMFMIILWVTVLAVDQLNAQQSFLGCCYYTLSANLLYFFLRNILQLDLSNIANVLNVFERTRANFGFGHYNTLGAACACNILMHEYLRKSNRSIVTRILDVVVLLMSVIMLLCSASRSAITSLVLYYLVYYSSKLDDLPLSKQVIFAIKMLRIVFVGAMILWVLLELDIMTLLVLAQRSHLVYKSLPMFFKTGQIWLGLGYASNVAYAEGATPYTTYWLDNAYIYYLITTGIIGLGLLLGAIVVMWRELKKRAKMRFGREMVAIFVAYLYISLFETILFSSGGLANYIYVPWFLIHISQNSNPRASGSEAAQGV